MVADGDMLKVLVRSWRRGLKSCDRTSMVSFGSRALQQRYSITKQYIIDGIRFAYSKGASLLERYNGLVVSRTDCPVRKRDCRQQRKIQQKSRLVVSVQSGEEEHSLNENCRQRQAVCARASLSQSHVHTQERSSIKAQRPAAAVVCHVFC